MFVIHAALGLILGSPPSGDSAVEGMYVYIHMYTYIHKYVCMCVYTCNYMYICIYIYIYIYMYITHIALGLIVGSLACRDVMTKGTYVKMYLYLYTCICRYVYMYMYIYICNTYSSRSCALEP